MAFPEKGHMHMFTLEELKNLQILVNKAPISGSEATTVALLQQKITQQISNITPVAEEVKTEETPA
jgi:hypothetical protein